ncbi:hypothetical protein KUTeg_015707 [Tegillarca granosa]|uniref:Uncharacterized protein n=1 Tax=Tegillarca granosa TaxID=220873 RepID=A0ABQ9EN39_TEGGR|nr:hypothetical protein KUTeg_015707 [Tegillarca granosa]
MNKGNFSRVFRWVILNVLFIVTNTQEVDVNKYLITKTNAERCQTFQERLRSLKNFESILNGFKANCEEEYYGITLTNTIIGVSTTKGTTEGTSRIPAAETSTLLSTTSSTKTFLVGTLLINASPLSSNDVWSKCYFKTKVFDGELQITNFNVTVLYQTDIFSDTVVRFQEIFISRDEEISAICKENASLKVYIGVAKDGKKIPVDTVNSGLKPSAELLINYTVMEDGRTVSAVMRMSDSGPFYNLLPGSFQTYSISNFREQITH